jgi:two-component system alkaline phosphatase synthesis response regulator PhoP
MTDKKVLIADDEAYIRLLVKSILGKDYIVLEAGDGEEAVNIARTQRPDLILMDIMMPKLDGVGACKVIKSDSSTEGIPVVMVSARGDTLDQEYAKDMGADGYITKPFNARELWDTVNRLLKSPE